MHKWIIPSGLIQKTWDCQLYNLRGHRSEDLFVLANSVDPDEMLQDAAFHLLVCFDSLSLSQHFFSHVGTGLPWLS